MKTTFFYQNYVIDKNKIVFNYQYQSKQKFDFSHTITFNDTLLPQTDHNLQRLAFFLGLSVIPYYYSLHFADEIVITAGQAETAALTFFKEAFMHGLAELRYTNGLAVSQPIPIRYDSPQKIPESQPQDFAERYLISNGGGKDSLVSGELLHSARVTASWFVLGYDSKRTENIMPSIKRSHYSEVIAANQIPDPYRFAKKFRQTHPSVYLGHKPFNLFLSFLGVLAAYIHGFKYFVTSNESSANTGNLEIEGLPVNHQYSKSLAYEQAFRILLKNHMSVGVNYFSAIRPFSAEQIGRYFTRFDTYFPTFMSCNNGIESGEWCNACPKCAYVFLLIYVFRGQSIATKIFQKNLLLDPKRVLDYLELLGLSGHRPFECVGEIEEVRKLFFGLKPQEVHPELSHRFAEFLAQQTPNYKKMLTTSDTNFSEHCIPEELWQQIQTQI